MKASIKIQLLFSSLLLLVIPIQAQVASEKVPLAVLESAYEKFKEPAITHRRFKHADIQPLIQKHSSAFKIEKLGESIDQRSISSLNWGKGQTKVMLWSQMHGNESTATMALFDLFNFLEGKNDGYDELRKLLDSELNLKFIPMLNPDGADAFKRRNNLDIDLNRDAISQISPEAVILKKARDDFEPEFGFNLHDQQTYYNVVNTPKQATISLLAPAYNYETEINEVRGRAMKTIAGMNELLQQLIPGGVGKYDDAFEPRAFGDNIQKWGTTTILIESGGYPNDPEKQYIRKINFMIILNALHQIATKGYESYTTEQYFAIPDNGMQLVDLMINEMQVKVNGKLYPLDLVIRRRESESNGSYYVSGAIDDLGDMQVYFGFETLDATGLEFTLGKVYPEAFENIEAISEEKALELLKQGYLAAKVKNGTARQLHGLPIQVLKTTDKISGGWMTGSAPNFFLAKEGDLKYAIVNGYLIDLQNPKKQEFKNRVL
ncbi:M14 family zinc carboxypeptidase [Algoriphagus sp. A40]|uniref:M14 family zinc carboxypeptidase n=1 Tax=Algoriphagus sp. A40 TaxID=1945863 RepID=UPI0009848A38|nr:M14 family zinc carboxypeptidase [Algoriphagus sp. A40]OOG70547.1 peptidase M14 [Algoriphagus sp. A40]